MPPVMFLDESGDHFRGFEELFNSLEFKIVACVVKKVEHLNRYGLSAVDPYMLSLSVLVERFVFECGSRGGSIVAEGRGQNLDNALELAFLDLKIRGTQYIPPTKIRKRIHNFAIHDKRENLAGLQIADIAATPIGRHVVGKKTYASYSSEGDFLQRSRKKISEGLARQLCRYGLSCAA